MNAFQEKAEAYRLACATEDSERKADGESSTERHGLRQRQRAAELLVNKLAKATDLPSAAALIAKVRAASDKDGQAACDRISAAIRATPKKAAPAPVADTQPEA